VKELQKKIQSIIPTAETKLSNALDQIVSIVMLILLNTDEKYIFHNLDHTINVVNNAISLIKEVNKQQANTLSTADSFDLLVAALLHDTGNIIDRAGHEQQSCAFAREILNKLRKKYPRQQRIETLILATRFPYQEGDTPADPTTQAMINIIRDADLGHLTYDIKDHLREYVKYYFEMSEIEKEKRENREQNERLQEEISFMTNIHPTFLTESTKDDRTKKQAKNLEKFKKVRPRLYANIISITHKHNNTHDAHEEMKSQRNSIRTELDAELRL